MTNDYKLQHKEMFLLDLQNNNYSEETIYNYRRDIEAFERFLQDKQIKFADINRQVISLYKGFLRNGEHLKKINVAESPAHQSKQHVISSKGSKMDERKEYVQSVVRNSQKTTNPLSARTINRMLSALRSYLTYLADFDLNPPIPASSIKLIKTEKKESQLADFSDLVRLIEAPEKLEKNKLVGLRNRAILEILFSTGMRISEIVNLKREQLNSEGKIYIMGKGKKARFVYLTERARGVLDEYLATRKDNYPALFIPYKGMRNASKDPQKVKLSTNYLQMKIKAYRLQLGIVIPTSAHSLRHGFATYLAEQGASPVAIQHLLGHESLQTTTRYVHASDRFAEEAHKTYHPLKE